jgi:hypothetical protein
MFGSHSFDDGTTGVVSGQSMISQSMKLYENIAEEPAKPRLSNPDLRPPPAVTHGRAKRGRDIPDKNVCTSISLLALSTNL